MLMFSPLEKSSPAQIRAHRMLSRSQSQRHKGVKVKLGVPTWLALVVGVWMVYQLIMFFNHKLSRENGLSVKKDDHFEKLKFGRKGLLVIGSEAKKIDEEEGRADAMEDETGKKIQGNQQEMEEVGKGEDFDDEELDTVRFDDPMDEIDSLNVDDDEEEEEEGVDDDASNDKHGEEEDDSPLERKNKDKVAVAYQNQ